MAEETVMLKRCAECESANEPDETTCEACGSTEFENPEAAGTELDCDHCGDVAVESPKGIFHEDMADKCVSCGYPGQVHVDDGNAYWSTSQEFWTYCEKDDCTECGELAREDVENLRDMLWDVHPILEEYLSEYPPNHPASEKAVKLMQSIEARVGKPPKRCASEGCRNSPLQDGLCQFHFEKRQGK
jgi:uncharacterized protein CbrC (UPF0167 family)